jgi:alkanesulfonate monooxygenase SsuD/methylene tetrahydromethanopterin reductase-like flavin-dependent oxidoreductase (luciferase family)
MKLGYFTLDDNSPLYGEYLRKPEAMLKDIVEHAVYCDELGFSSFWVPEHHGPTFGMLPTPGAMVGHLAAKTRRIRLGVACVVLPINQPLRIAEEYGVLDHLSGGRISIAFGRGFDEYDYKMFGVSFRDSREILREGVELVIRAWIEKGFRYKGKHYQVNEPCTLNQYPLQSPYPEVWIACWSRGTLEMSAELGHSVVFTPFAAGMAFGGLGPAVSEFKRLAREAGHTKPLKTACSYFCAIAKDSQDAARHRERLLRLLRGLVPAIPHDLSTAPPNLAYFVDIAKKIGAMKADDLGDGSIATGDAEKVTEILKRAEAAGIDETILNVYFGGISHRGAMEQLELLAKHVLPHFESASISASNAESAARASRPTQT